MSERLVKIVRPCKGRRGADLKPGEVRPFHRLAAEAMVRRGVAVFVKMEPPAETKMPVIPEPEPPRQTPEPPPAAKSAPTDDWPFRCPVCERGYRTERGMNRHIKTKHAA